MDGLPGRTTTAWSWVLVLVLVLLGSGQEVVQDADRAGPEVLFWDSEPTSGGEFFPVPLWKFMKVSGDSDSSDSGRPQFSCSDSSLSLRLRLVRYSDLRLDDGRRLSALPEKCGASARTFGSWLLLKLPYGGCLVGSWVSNGSSFHQLKLRYFDHLLQDHVTAAASCRDPAAPLVRCRASDLTMKLPLGSRLQRVEALVEDGVVGTALGTTATPDAVLVHVSRAADTDSFLEMRLVDAAGEMAAVLVACLKSATGTLRERRRRALKQPNLLDPWDFGIFNNVNSPGNTQSNTNPATATPTHDRLFEMWDFSEIPVGIFQGEDAEKSVTAWSYGGGAGCDPTTAASTTDGCDPTTAASTTDGCDPTAAASTTDGCDPTAAASTTDGCDPTAAASTTDGCDPTTAASTTDGCDPTAAASTTDGCDPTAAASTTDGCDPTAAASTTDGCDPPTAASTTDGCDPPTAAGPPATTTTPAGPPATTTTPAGPPATTTTPAGPPATTTTPAGPPATTTTPAGPPATTTTPAGPPAATPAGPPTTTS